MPLSIDRTGDNTFALAHYGKQNRDLVADPDMVSGAALMDGIAQ